MNHMSCQNWKKREREIREIILSKIINITEYTERCSMEASSFICTQSMSEIAFL